MANPNLGGDWDAGQPTGPLFYDNLFALGALGEDFSFPCDTIAPADHAAACQAIPEVNHQFSQARAAAHDPACTKRFLDSEEDCDDDEVKDAERPARRQKTERSAAADKKADREKARRGKMNEKYVELAKLVDPDSEPKSDKTSILCDAIKRMQHLITENHQTKQLNKFLNEKLASLEREKTAPLYQHSMFMGQQQQQQQQQLLAQPGYMIPQHGLLPQQPGLIPHGVVTGVPVSSNHINMAGPSTSSTPASTSSSPPLPQSLASLAQQQQQQQQPQMAHVLHRSSSAGLSGYSNVQLCKPLLYSSQQLQGMLPFPNASFQYMPQEMLDSSQSDAQLRPPAA